MSETTIHEVFTKIKTALSSHVQNCERVFERYRRSAAAAKADAGRYKAEEAHYREAITRLSSEAYEALRADETRTCGVVNAGVAVLQQLLSEYLTTAPDPSLVGLLALYRDFNLSLDIADVEALVERADGNFTALRLVRELAAKNGIELSGLPSAEEYRRSLADLALTDGTTYYTPLEYVREAVEVYRLAEPDGIRRVREDGTVFVNGQQFAETTGIFSNARMKSQLKYLDTPLSDFRPTNLRIVKIPHINRTGEPAKGLDV